MSPLLKVGPLVERPGLCCRQSGSVLIYSLIVLAVGSLVLAGWVQLLATRAIATVDLGDRINQRLILENSRLLARQYLLENVLPGNYDGPVSLAAADGWAAFSLTGTTTGAPLDVTPDSPGAPQIEHLNVFSPEGSDGYGLNISATLSDGISGMAWDFQTRSSSPIFGHDFFTSQKPTLLVGTQIVVSTGWYSTGNTVVWVPNSPNDFDFTSETYQAPTVSLPTMTPPLDGAGQPVLMSNFAFPPVTSGPAGGGSGYGGFLSVIQPAGGGLLYKAGWPPARSLAGASDPAPAHVAVYSDGDESTLPNPHVDLVMTGTAPAPPYLGVSSDGAGTVTIDLSANNSQLIYITNDVSTLILQGQLLGSADYAASATDDKAEEDEVDPRAGLLIVYVQDGGTTRNLTSIQLQGQNNRRVYLAVKKTNDPQSGLTLTTNTTNARWRLAGVFENVPITWSLAGDLQLIGGLRSDASLAVTGGSVSVFREADPRLLSRHADRLAWLEAYRQ